MIYTKINQRFKGKPTRCIKKTVPGLQKMIDKCLVYSNTWRLKFGIKKTKCISYGQTILKCEPKWSLGQIPNDNVDNIEILGMILSSDGKCINQVDSRIFKCRKSYFSLNNVGMPYPGLPVDLKLHLWHTICRPILTFGLETVYLNRAMYSKLESLQGTIVKAFLGLSRYSHHSKLLTALDILPIEESIKSMSVSLMKRIFLVNSPLRCLCSFFMSKYLLTGKYSKSTLFGRLLDMGLSPLLSALSTFKYTQKYSARDGVVDSLQGVLYRADFLNRNSTAHILTKLLTRF